MINEGGAYAYCVEDISKIENYDKAIKDSEMWDCHHKLEIHNDYRNSIEELKMMNLYYHRPASELIFLTRKEHNSLHHLDCKRSDDTRKKQSLVRIGKPHPHKGHKISEENKKIISNK